MGGAKRQYLFSNVKSRLLTDYPIFLLPQIRRMLGTTDITKLMYELTWKQYVQIKKDMSYLAQDGRKIAL